MDRHRGDRPGDGGAGGGGRHARMPSRWSSGSPTGPHHRYPNHSRGGGGEGFSGGGGGGGGGGRHHPYRHPSDYAPPHGGGGPGFRGGPGGFGNQMQMAGPRRGGGGGFQGRGGSPSDYHEGSNFAKLFIGSVPRTATEEEIRPLFEEHGEVVEVALIKDKRTGQQQGCCFIKYATSEEADRAIRALHNQYSLPGGTGPIQVRYADGERERLGTVEHKLFVGALNKQATEKEIEEIFSPYGRVEDVYIMRDDLKQSRGCGFVKFSNREMALAAMNALHGKHMMRGCDQPLIVRFADPKRPRPGESRGGPAFGGPGFGPRSQAPFGVRPPPNFGEPMGGHMAPNAWHPVSPPSMGPSSQAGSDGFGINLAGKGGVMAASSAATDNLGAPGGLTNGSLPGISAKLSSSQGFNLPMAQAQVAGQQISPAQKPLMSPQHLLPSLQLPQTQQTLALHSQAQPLQAPMQPFGQLQIPQSVGLSSSQGPPSQQLMGLGSQMTSSQSLMQQNMSAAALQTPLGLQQQGVPGGTNQQQLPASSISQLLQQPIQQLPSQLSQALLQQQAQALQSSFQSSQHAISQLQQQLQLMQQSSLSQQQSSQTIKPQQQWSGIAPQAASSTPAGAPAALMASTVSSTLPVTTTQPVVALTCNWTEHTSPEGYKYYYNSVTKESKWEKPEEFTGFEQQQKLLLLQQQQQQKLAVQQLQSSSQTQSHSQQTSQTPHVQPQMQLSQQAQLQLLQPSVSYQASGVAGHQSIQDFNYSQLHAPSSVTDPARAQQGIQAAQEWMWKNKPAGYQQMGPLLLNAPYSGA